VPLEWNLRDAYVKTLSGQRVIDLARSNLHVWLQRAGRATISRTALEARLFSLPATPDWIPYRTSYYERSWASA
jgi:aminopeptidase-like protein